MPWSIRPGNRSISASSSSTGAVGEKASAPRPSICSWNELETDTIDIEVLSWNEAGIGFWRPLGFKERSIYMRYEKPQ